MSVIIKIRGLLQELKKLFSLLDEICKRFNLTLCINTIHYIHIMLVQDFV